MLKPTGLATATALLAVLGGLVWWTQKHPKTPDTLAPAAPKILAVGEDQIESIRMAKTGANPVTLKRSGEKWEITEPKPYPADADAVRSLTGTLSTLTSDRMIDEKPASLAEFGLDRPASEIDVTVKGGKVNRILIGSDAPVGNAAYVKLAGNPGVYALNLQTKTSLDKSVDDLRDKRLLVFNQEKVKSVAFGNVEFTKNSVGDWQMSKPQVYRADTQKVEDLIRKLHEAKGDPTGKDKIATVAVTDDTGVHTLAVEKSMNELAEALKDKTADDFRNKKLFDFGFNNPSKLEIDGQNLDKSPQKQAIIDKLRDLSAAKFAPAMRGTQAMKIGVTSGKLEQVTINKSGDEYLAQRENDPSVYAIDAKTFDELKAAINKK